MQEYGVFLLLFIGLGVSVYIFILIRKKKIKKQKEDAKLIAPFEELLSESIGKLYLSYSYFQTLTKEYQKIFQQITVNRFLKKHFPSFFAFSGDEGYRKNKNALFLVDEKKKYSDFFVALDKHKHGLTQKQLEAVFTDEDAVLVNAGAGTGKTKTIESKVVYLHEIKGVPLDQILVITFSKKSQEDMIERIAETLKKAKIIVEAEDLKRHIATFHAFGLGVVKEAFGAFEYLQEDEKEVGVGFDGKRVLDEEQQNQIIQLVCEKMIKKSDISCELLDFMLFFSSPQFQVKDFKSRGEYYERAKKTYQTLLKNDAGYSVSVKSYGEFVIANYLFSKGIKVEYEPKGHYITNEQGKKISYKPDFYLPDYKIYIEYFGVDRNNQTADYIDAENYVSRMHSKIAKHKRSGNKLIDLRYADFQEGGVEGLLNKLKQELYHHKVVLLKNLNINLKEVFPKPLSALEMILKNFLALYKESGETLSNLEQKVLDFDDINRVRNQKFLKIFAWYFECYTQLLKEGGYLDFGDMIILAQELLQKEVVNRKYRYILVDEFQDISRSRANLIKALIIDPLDTKLFCVGDDWQSIYKFAGSNINIFWKFQEIFGYTEHITLDQTFRFNQGISNISGAFVMENKDQTKKVLKALDSAEDEKMLIFQTDFVSSPDGNDYKNVLNLLFQDYIQRKSPTTEKHKVSLLYLTRYSLPKYIKRYPISFFSYLKEHYHFKEKKGKRSGDIKYEGFCFHLQIETMTVHRSKGLEADYVILDYVNQNDGYDFPSNMVDDPILDLVMDNQKGTILNAEERRVFYVGMTRGKHLALLLYSKGKESLFLKDLIKLNSNSLKVVYNQEKNQPSLLENHYSMKCQRCEGKLISSQYGQFLPEYICSHYMVGCSGRYYLYNNKLYEYPVCKNPGCGGVMKMRKNVNTGWLFLGCSEYPTCRSTDPLSHIKQEIIVKD